jgi:peroxiredoxin
MLMATSVIAAEPALVFDLVGADGRPHTQAEWRGKKAVVLLFLATECPVSNFYAPEYVALAQRFAKENVAVYGVHCDRDLTAVQAKKHADEYKLVFPILLDPKQVLASATKVRVTPEAVVLSADGVVQYRGRIDDRYAENGRRRDEAQTYDLREAIEAVVAGKSPKVRETKAFGCLLPKR